MAGVIFGALTVALVAAACESSSDSPGGTGGTGGSGGATAGTGGGSGGSGGGGSGGGGGTTGGSGGTGGSTTDAGKDSGGMAPAAFLDDCFNGLRPLAQFLWQISDRSSSNGAYRVRLALEYPPGSVGTSGTIPWKAVRVGIVTPQTQVCIKDEAALASVYKGSHHNCMDSLTVMSGGLNYEIKPPDVAPGRKVATLAVTGEAAIPAVMLPTLTCKGKDGEGFCASGGPCQ
jgi:hypothetical protein